MSLLQERPTTTFPDPGTTTAPAPAEWRGLARDEIRLLVATGDGLRHQRFRDLPDQLQPGDLLVVNNSAVEPRQLDANLVGRGRVIAHLAQRLDRDSWVIELRSSPNASRSVLDADPGDQVTLGPARLTLVAPYPGRSSSPTGRGNRLWRARAEGPVEAELRAHARPIAYGYLDRRYPLSAYQSVFGIRPGSAESPSASRPFTAELVTRLVAGGISLAPITLHTGVSSQEAGEAPGAEWFEVSASTARVIRETAIAGGRVIAVGTTAARAVESAVVRR
ncbi:MAG: S-adenosylmethionine:tRNA ribosyltransferase-isomerase, partial [Nocardioides sp.]|uniref:S-adenosylmethionine:tRNA ribosyltransferase-isomerase n=1 Tax=Nocardioides sp. TaxID=35761 RepID=UPI0039E6CE5D